LFLRFGEVPADFSPRLMLDLADFFTAGIGHDFEAIRIVQKSAKNYRAVSRTPVGADGCELEVTGIGTAAIAVQGASELRSPRGKGHGFGMASGLSWGSFSVLP
jgi:hypothetical protein